MPEMNGKMEKESNHTPGMLQGIHKRKNISIWGAGALATRST